MLVVEDYWRSGQLQSIHEGMTILLSGVIQKLWIGQAGTRNSLSRRHYTFGRWTRTIVSTGKGRLELHDCCLANVRRYEQRSQCQRDWNKTPGPLSAQWRNLSWGLVLTSIEGFMDESHQHLTSHFLSQMSLGHTLLCCRLFEGIMDKENENMYLAPSLM